MEKKKVRATRTNGRKDSNGVFKAGHNDRSFNLENAEHVDADRSKWNVYWDYCKRQVLFHKFWHLIFHKKRQLNFHTYLVFYTRGFLRGFVFLFKR